MSEIKRDLTDYVAQYRKLPFEPIQIDYRRKLVLRQIARYAPIRLLEVGCGVRPLFTDLSDNIAVTVVEPAKEFFDYARELARGRDRVKVLQGFIESADLDAAEFDMIILSCVLHEVPDPAAMLDAVWRVCAPNAVLHVNVPNARSMHRLLAVAMGLMPSPDQQSDTQRLMQQRHTPYNAERLRDAVSDAGFKVIDGGSLFVKPFSHSQMQALIDCGFMTHAMLDGLDKLVELAPDLGSEIWMNARKEG
jgi:2-polyprenyl-3-methyl-5-hydroxy-6-metoxy-1,4-benzoquinol methylase